MVSKLKTVSATSALRTKPHAAKLAAVQSANESHTKSTEVRISGWIPSKASSFKFNILYVSISFSKFSIPPFQNEFIPLSQSVSVGYSKSISMGIHVLFS